MPCRADKTTGRERKEKSAKFDLVLDKSLLMQVRNNNYLFYMNRIIKPQKNLFIWEKIFVFSLSEEKTVLFRSYFILFRKLFVLMYYSDDHLKFLHWGYFGAAEMILYLCEYNGSSLEHVLNVNLFLSLAEENFVIRSVKQEEYKTPCVFS